MSRDENDNRYFDVQALVGAIPFDEVGDTAMMEQLLVELGHHDAAVQKEISDIVGKMSCADIKPVRGQKRQNILRLHGVSRADCSPTCHYLRGGFNCILYLIMLNEKNGRFINPDLAEAVRLG